MSLNVILRSEPGDMAGRPLSKWLITTVKGVIAAYTNWRTERTAMATLSSMSDLMLKDMGLSRCQITSAARGSLYQSLDDLPGKAEQTSEAVS